MARVSDGRGRRVLASNTRVLVLLDQSTGRYYLWLMNRCLAAPKLNGPWTVASDPPFSPEVAKRLAALRSSAS